MPALDESDELGQTAVTLAKDILGDEALVPRNLQLVVIGNGTFSTHPLPESAAVTIGRSNECDIAVDDRSISRKHAVLNIGETVTIEDLGSVNGTQVRGKSVEAGHAVVVSVGELVTLGEISMMLQQRSRPVRPRRLWTHDYFEARLEEECARVARSGAAFALLRIHTDRRAPSTFVESTLSELVRESDILGKYGPHEYEVLLPDTPLGKADDALKRIDGKLRERGLKCSITIACCPRDGRSPYQLAAKVQAPASTEKPATRGTDIVVSDVQMQSLHRLVDQVASSQIGVLLLGETGVGKEVFARALHNASRRSAGPFVDINCAALTETLLESELFGHEKGAFTHAVASKPGLLEAADGGTVLLDEIGDMPLSTQVKLLRVIEESQLRRVGGLKARPIDVRFVAATNSDLESQVERGAFRRDLYFRLNGVTIVIPPLRERVSELEPLVKSFIHRIVSTSGEPPPAVSSEAMDVMRSYGWPGNIRELKHMIERAVLLCAGGEIRPEHLPIDRMRATLMTAQSNGSPRLFTWVGGASQRAAVAPDDRPTEAMPPLQRRKGSTDEQQRIMQALEQAGGNQTTAARILGISRRTLVNRLNELEQVHRPRKHKTKRDE